MLMIEEITSKVHGMTCKSLWQKNRTAESAAIAIAVQSKEKLPQMSHPFSPFPQEL